MTIGKDDVVEVLSDFRLQSIRFSAGPIQVNVREYNRVSDYIDTGAVKVKVTKQVRRYEALKNTLFLQDKNFKIDFDARTNVLHECTHIITDINKAPVTRLQDEAAAYLAQMTFMKLLDRNVNKPPIGGGPMNNIIRIAMGLVDKYHLGEPKGFGARVSTSDIDDLGRLVRQHPEYSHIKEADPVDADGVGVSADQLNIHLINETARQGDKVKYDRWLVDTMAAAQGNGPRKAPSFESLSQHFFMVYKPVAVQLLARFASVIAGDIVSEVFGRFNADQKAHLIQQLKIPKPEG